MKKNRMRKTISETHIAEFPYLDLLSDNAPQVSSDYYEDAAILNKQINNPDTFNVAVMAKYGAGKSSVINTYLSIYRSREIKKKNRKKADHENAEFKEIKNEKNLCGNEFEKVKLASKEYILCYVAENGGYISGDSQQTVTENCDGVAVEAIANEGYEFVEWSDGVTTAERVDKSVNSDKTVTAKFEAIKYTVRYVTDGNGTIEGDASQIIKSGENGTTVTAIPNKGFQFIGWSDGITTAERVDKSVNSDKTVTAKFEAIKYTVRYVTDGNGTIEGDASQIIKSGENGTTVTAIPNKGFQFIGWSDGVETAFRTENSVLSNISVTAKFEEITFSVRYVAVLMYGKGRIEGETNQTIKLDENAKPVIAVPAKGYLFAGWSDGVKTLERQDFNINENLTIRAYFENGYVYDYTVNNRAGGKIEGKTHQMIASTDEIESVTAVPNKGYVFTGWSDHDWRATRTDEIDRKFDYNKTFGYTAYFEPIQKKFRYNYGLAHGAPVATEITLNRKEIESTEFVIPKLEGYTFCGWYADQDYKVKIADWNGRYMYGYAAFTLESDTLYARWKSNNAKEEIPVFKILLVFVDELKATLYSSLPNGTDDPINVHRVMGTLDREICALIPWLMSERLNDWLDGIARFEIDCFYTTQVVTEEYINYEPKVTTQYILATFNFPQTDSLVSSYHSVISIFGVNDYEGRLVSRNTLGMAGKKYANVYFDGFYVSEYINRIPFENVLRRLKTDIKKQEDIIETFIHEMIHTIEMMYPYGKIVRYHDAFYDYLSNVTYDPFEADRLYLLGEMPYNGEVGGIPRDFWTDKKDEMLKRIVW